MVAGRLSILETKGLFDIIIRIIVKKIICLKTNQRVLKNNLKLNLISFSNKNIKNNKIIFFKLFFLTSYKMILLFIKIILNFKRNIK